MPKINIDWEIQNHQARDLSEIEAQSDSNPNPEELNKGAKSHYGELGYAVTAAIVTGALVFTGVHKWSSASPPASEPTIESVPAPKVGLPAMHDSTEAIPEIPTLVSEQMIDRSLGVGGFHYGEIEENGMEYSLFVDSAYLRTPLKEDFNAKIRTLLRIANSNVDESTQDYLKNSNIGLMYLIEDEAGCVENIFKYKTSPVSPRLGFLRTVTCPFEQIDNVSMAEREVLMGMLQTYLRIVYDLNKNPSEVAKIWEAVTYASHGETWLQYRIRIGTKKLGLTVDDYEKLLLMFPREP